MNTLKEKKRRVFVVGLDGATFDIIIPMIEKGKLPNLAKMMKSGTYGELTSTIPPNSSVAWSSFMTGKNPGKHGVYYFLEKKVGSYERPVISSRSIKSRTLWRILSDHDKNVCIVNVPVTYPPEEVNGYLISGLLAPDKKSNFTYPPSLHMELLKEIGDYPLDHEPEQIWSKGDEIGAYQHAIYATKKVMEATEYLMKRIDWDFFMTVFTITDRFQHVGWKYTLPWFQEKHPGPANKFGNLIEIAYELADDLLGKIKASLDEDTILIVLSDHGFGPISYKFYINKWLIDNGFLRLKKGVRFTFSSKRFLTNILKRSSFIRRSREVLHALTRDHPESGGGYALYRLIDWSKTKAFSSFSGGEEIIYINLKRREPMGIVKPGREYEELRDDIISRLYNVKDYEGRSIIEKAYKREDIYNGEYLCLAPDIQFVTREMSVHPESDLFAEKILVRPEERPEEYFPALHRLNGVFLLEGRSVKRNNKLFGTNIIDLAPTILYLLDLPIPKDMDGRPLLECFDMDFTKTPSFSDTVLKPQPDDSDFSYSDLEDQKLKKMLQDLGYLS